MFFFLSFRCKDTYYFFTPTQNPIIFSNHPSLQHDDVAPSRGGVLAAEIVFDGIGEGDGFAVLAHVLLAAEDDGLRAVHLVDAVDDGIQAPHLLEMLGIGVEQVLLDG